MVTVETGTGTEVGRPMPGLIAGICELTLQARDLAFHGPVAHPGADRSVYLEDPEGNVLEVWDFFDHGAGAAHGVDALG